MTRKTLVSEIKENGGHRAGIAGARDTMFRLYKKGREFVTGVIVYFLSCKCTRLLSQVLNTHCIVERKWRCACMCENTLTSWKFWKERARGNRVLTWGRFHHRWSLIGQHLFAADTHTHTHRFFTQKNLSNAPVGKLDGNVGVLLPWGVGDGRLSPLWSRETPCMALEQVSMSAMMAGRQAGRSKDRSSWECVYKFWKGNSSSFGGRRKTGGRERDTRGLLTLDLLRQSQRRLEKYIKCKTGQGTHEW